jgi:hypothetical protein
VAVLPNVADQFATGLITTAVSIFHETFGGRENTNAEAVEDTRDFGVTEVETAAR